MSAVLDSVWKGAHKWKLNSPAQNFTPASDARFSRYAVFNPAYLLMLFQWDFFELLPSGTRTLLVVGQMRQTSPASHGSATFTSLAIINDAGSMPRGSQTHASHILLSTSNIYSKNLHGKF